jgi:hypothetical protein
MREMMTEPLKVGEMAHRWEQMTDMMMEPLKVGGMAQSWEQMTVITMGVDSWMLERISNLKIIFVCRSY